MTGSFKWKTCVSRALAAASIWLAWTVNPFGYDDILCKRWFWTIRIFPWMFFFKLFFSVDRDPYESLAILSSLHLLELIRMVLEINFINAHVLLYTLLTGQHHLYSNNRSNTFCWSANYDKHHIVDVHCPRWNQFDHIITTEPIYRVWIKTSLHMRPVTVSVNCQEILILQ